MNAEYGDLDDEQGADLAVMLRPALARWKTILAVAALAGAAGYAGSFALTPRFSSHTTFLPPQQQQSAAASALASLGGLAAGLTGASSLKNPAEQFIALMQSETVTGRMIDRFHLMKVYGLESRELSRKTLLERTTIVAGKKDGLITVSVEDTDPKRAAAMADAYVEELRHLTSTLAVSEAQQRRMFFQEQMEDARAKLVAAQTALQQSGFNAGALNAEPSSTATGFVRLRSDLASAQVKLETLQERMAPTSAEVRQQSATVKALEDQLRKLESAANTGSDSPDYIGKYRAFKYEETLFDLMAKQYELARVDESREGAMIQVVDPAHEAERKSWPHRSFFLAGAAFAGLLLATLRFVLRARSEA